MVKVGFNIIKTEGCCAVLQLYDFSHLYGYFDFVPTDYESIGSNTKGAYENLFLELKKVLKKFKDNKAGAVMQVWFVKVKGERKYQADEFRKLILKNLKGFNLGSYINPSTGNRVQGYQFKL